MMTPEACLHDALTRVEANADADWKAAAYAVVERLAQRWTTITTDDVWIALSWSAESTHEPRAMGAVMRRAARAGLITPTSEWVCSLRPECHQRPVKVWRCLKQAS